MGAAAKTETLTSYRTLMHHNGGQNFYESLLNLSKKEISLEYFWEFLILEKNHKSQENLSLFAM